MNNRNTNDLLNLLFELKKNIEAKYVVTRNNACTSNLAYYIP